MKALVLLSGGQDSTTCLYWAKTQFSNVEAIGFDYGQKHIREIDQAKLIAEKAGVKFTVVDLKGVFGGSSLVNHTDTNEPHPVRRDLPSSFTAGRNMVFLGIAAGYAFNNGLQALVTGVCQTDYSGYPDCRREFVDSMEDTIALALDSRVRIYTPLMYKNKAETWLMAKELNILDVIINDTMTDYNGNIHANEWGMGAEDNPASILRAKGYREAKENGWL